MSRRSVAALFLVWLTMSGCGAASSPSAATRGAPRSASSPPAASIPTAPAAPVPAGSTALLHRLRMAPPASVLAPYRRVAFGDGWDYDRTSGCNTRDRVLIIESVTPVVLGPRCKVLAGRWVSRYDGVTVTDPARLQVDHFVPLANAWSSGAASWTAARREQFANDLTDPATLVAVTGSTNESKGEAGPDHWLPPRAADRCQYAADWVEVKGRWDLSVTPTERAALERLLASC